MDDSTEAGPLPAPPRLISRLVARSGRALCATATVFALAALLTLVVFWPIEIQEDFQAYLQCDGPQRGRFEAWQAAKKGRTEQAPKKLLGRRLEQGHPIRNVPKFFIKLIYATHDGGNVFTPEGITDIRDIERNLMRLPSYNRLCLLGSRECYPPLSVVNYFFASQDPTTGDVIPDGKGDQILDVQAILANIAMKDTFFVDRFFGVSSSQVQSMLEGNVTRSVFRFGLPYPGFSGPEDRNHEQTLKFRSFIAEELYPYLRGASTKNVRVYFYGDIISSFEVESTVWHDASYAVGSFLFILCYLVVYLRSPFLAMGALFCIALSFPLAYAVYCLAYGHGKMIAINFLSLFVVLGVGADDVFVLSDVWHHSRCHGIGEPALARRFWSMYRKAGAAIFATSATTAVSFFANLASSIGPLRQFGFFMGTCITMNWLVVATIYPLMLVAQERRRPGAGLGGASLIDEQAEGATEMQESLVDYGSRAAIQEPDEVRPSQSELKQTRTCRGIGWRLAVRVVSIMGLAVPAAALAGALQRMRPSSSVPQFFPQGSNLGDLQDLQSRFGNESTVASIHLKQCGGALRADDECNNQNIGTPRLPGSFLEPAPAPPPPSSGPHGPRPTPAGPALAPAPAPVPRPLPALHPAPAPVPRPLPALHPSLPQLPQKGSTQPALRPSAKPTQAPAPAPAASYGEDLQVALEVRGHSETEVEVLGSMLRESLADQFGLDPEDIDVDINGQGDWGASPKDTQGTHISDWLSWLGRRLSGDEQGEPPVVEVNVLVHNIPEDKRAEVERWMREQRAAMTASGVSLLGKYKPQSGGVAPTHPKPHTHIIPTLAPAPVVHSSAAPAHAPPPPPWHQSKTPSMRPPPRPAPAPLPLPPPRAPPPSTPPAPLPPPFHLPRLPRPAPAPVAPAVAAPKLHGVKARGMTYDRTATVIVLFGFVPSGGSAAYEIDPGFDMRAPGAQRALVDFCDHVEQRVDLKAFKTNCWPRDFAHWLQGRGMSFPSTSVERDLHMYLSHAPKSVEGHYGLSRDGRSDVTWLAVDFRVEFDTHSSGRNTEPYMNAWEQFMSDEAAQLATGHSTRGLGAPVSCSELFLRAEAELRVVGSALASWLCSVACALVAVGVFTWDIKLSAIATFAIFATAACSMFAITSIFQWHFGLMEAVSLIIFCGFSVDYPLHVVQAYVQERSQGAGVRKALREVGFAVGSGCATTCGAAAFLLLCEIRIFTRFGQVLIVNMLFSIVFAVAWIPAVLEWRELKPDAKSQSNQVSDSAEDRELPPDGFAELPGSAPGA